MKILAVIHKNVSIDVKDNYDEALKYMVDHGAPFNLEYRTVNTRIKDMATFTQTVTDYDIVFLNYDPNTEKTHVCYSNPVRPGLVAGVIPCGTAEDGIYLSQAIAHELLHAMAFTLDTEFNIKTNVHAVLDTYFHNNDWNYPGGNFAQAWAILKPYMAILYPLFEPTSPATPLLPHVVITRTYQEKETLGDLRATNGNRVFRCKTLELPWLQNQQRISCIPTGWYTVSWTYSWKRMRYIYQLDKVKDRTYVQIHSGNYAFKKSGKPDIEGCILVGNAFKDINGDSVVDIVQSTVTLKALEDFLGRKSFTLQIK